MPKEENAFGVLISVVPTAMLESRIFIILGGRKYDHSHGFCKLVTWFSRTNMTDITVQI